MLARARTTEGDCDTSAANDDCIIGGPSTRTKYTYDANGNVGERQGQYITWASYNYPIYVYAGSGSTAERVDFNYGPDRQRWSQTYYNLSAGSWETTDYIGGLFEMVFGSAPGTTDRHYIYAGSEPVAVYARTSSGTNTFSYMLSDHQGSVSDLTSSTGTSVVNESFTPYGLRRNPATWSGAASNSDLTTAAGITRQGYTFQTQLGLWMGLNHMNGRVQDSMIGRFLSADPHIPDPTNTQSYNRYSYVNNNPVTLVDPTGFDADCMNTGSGCSGGDGDTLQEVVVTASKWPGPVVTQDPLDQIPGLAITGLQAGTPKQLPEETLPEVVVTAPKPKPQGKPNPILCGLARGAAGAAGAVAATATFATLTGNIEALNPAVLGAAATVGFVGGVVGPGIVGGIVSGAASIATHAPSGYSPGGMAGMYNDALGGAASPAYAVPAGAVGGGAFGAVSGATGFADAGAVLTGAGAGGGALIGANAGGLAAAAGLSVTGVVYALIAPAGCGGGP